MRNRIFVIDAFASRRFTGNPAAVMPMQAFLPDATLQAIAAENNLAETAFIVRDAEEYRIRWFTPSNEVPLCGHATLASAAAVMERLEPGRRGVTFHSVSGPLPVSRDGAGYLMNLPARPNAPVVMNDALRRALGVEPLEVRSCKENYFAILVDAEAVRRFVPNLEAIAALGPRSGLIISARGDNGFDLVSRYFTPQQGVPEDPVTGSAHCALVPYWAERLGKAELRAYQASSRGGEIRCRHLGDRVELGGSCTFYMEGEAEV
jgi:PhzF family phenazine biosynthesis protein